MDWSLDGVGKRINFTWTAPTEHKYIIYTMHTKTKA